MQVELKQIGHLAVAAGVKAHDVFEDARRRIECRDTTGTRAGSGARGRSTGGCARAELRLGLTLEKRARRLRGRSRRFGRAGAGARPLGVRVRVAAGGRRDLRMDALEEADSCSGRAFRPIAHLICANEHNAHNSHSHIT